SSLSRKSGMSPSTPSCGRSRCNPWLRPRVPPTQGACCNRQTGGVEWLSRWGILAGSEQAYVEHYAALDPYRPSVEAEPHGRWLQLSECLPPSLLRHDECGGDRISGGDGLDRAMTRRRGLRVMLSACAAASRSS